MHPSDAPHHQLLTIQPVIMAGGSGTRLWPLSRAGYPKQFLVLHGNTSLLQQAAQRLMALTGAAAPVVVGNEEHRFLILDQLREVQCMPCAVVLEPAGRNTAPAVTLAALQAAQDGTDPVLVITPADQTVTDPAAFTAALERAVQEAAQGAVVILGITPDRPETGYGYIQTGPLPSPGTAQHPGGASAVPEVRLMARPVQRFVEKPDAATAAAYLGEGGYFWNGGIFVLRASTWLAALERFCAPRQGGLRSRAGGICGLCSHGAVPRQRHRHPHGAIGCGLERPGRLGRRVASRPTRWSGQRRQG